MLELLKGGEIKVTQSEQFSDITIKKGENHGKNDSVEYTDYDTIQEETIGGDVEYEIVEGIQD